MNSSTIIDTLINVRVQLSTGFVTYIPIMPNILLIADIVSKIISLATFVCLAMNVTSDIIFDIFQLFQYNRYVSDESQGRVFKEKFMSNIN